MVLFSSILCLSAFFSAYNTQEGKRIEVDLSEQKVRAYEQGKLVYEFRCSTGRGNCTPAGEWQIIEKRRYNKALPQYGGGAIPYSLRLNVRVNGKARRINLHAYRVVPRYPASNGCIRLTYNDAPKLFAWSEVGMPVAIVP